ncbi:protoporphyrinogen oxidase [Aspergillus sclerotioniger CBS 115572]|uniref:Protoporphyrinogen oxidase n=1 Tax=Aspergillus sclerotioniger CBS 115572 TaxID=1450535 RepID=A0A317X0W7_9EURO|nr:protoporphyrinogen oxidase [Aspergillus sclerotioniger CBS 115572]PWY91821.1 protoporphyrinogen oxidase [Aspergillus sclerotioniger CBS 115572]
MRLPGASSRVLRQAQAPLAFARIVQRHALHTKPFDAAVIGAGITGLTAAYQLSRDPSCSKVTLYEKSSHLGGWISSEKIPVPGGGHVVFEYGPRTLRPAAPASLPMMDLVRRRNLGQLDLLGEVRSIPKDHPASTNRYIYYPDRLVRLPSVRKDGIIHTFIRMLQEPMLRDIAWSLLTEGTKFRLEPEGYLRDESIADFLSRRLSSKVVDNVVSAVFAGIFGGDIYRLSAETVLGKVRLLEKEHDSIVVGMFADSQAYDKTMAMDDFLAIESVDLEQGRTTSTFKVLKTLGSTSSVVTMQDGLGQITDTLATRLRESGKVEIVSGKEVTAISQDSKTRDLTIGFGRADAKTHNRVIATHSPWNLCQQLRNTKAGQSIPSDTIQNLTEHKDSVTIMVVNLFYTEENLVPVEGFGYLLPNSVPFEQNPERALGVIFADQASVGQDTAPGTKLTVMMGGYLWDGWTEADYPDPDTAIQMAQTLLHRHLGITATPAVARSRLLRDAIPQYTVGHLSRIDRLSQSVRRDFDKRLTLAGSWYGTLGIGVVDCIRQAYLASSYGVGSKKLGRGKGPRPWTKYDYHHWELEGGIVTSPIRFDGVSPDERKHF